MNKKYQLTIIMIINLHIKEIYFYFFKTKKKWKRFFKPGQKSLDFLNSYKWYLLNQEVFMDIKFIYSL